MIPFFSSSWFRGKRPKIGKETEKKRVVVLWPTECWARTWFWEAESQYTALQSMAKKGAANKKLKLHCFGYFWHQLGSLWIYKHIYIYIRLFGSVWFSLESHFHGHFPSHWAVGIRRCFIHLAHLAGVSSGFLMKLIHQTSFGSGHISQNATLLKIHKRLQSGLNSICTISLIFGKCPPKRHTDLHPTHQQTPLSLQIKENNLQSTKCKKLVYIAAVPSLFHFEKTFAPPPSVEIVVFFTNKPTKTPGLEGQ